MEGEAIVDISPSGVAGFQANWDGESPIGDVGQDSPLFCSDPCLSQWTERHPEIEGLPMSGDLLLHLGAMMGTESGGARFSMFGIEH